MIPQIPIEPDTVTPSRLSTRFMTKKEILALAGYVPPKHRQIKYVAISSRVPVELAELMPKPGDGKLTAWIAAACAEKVERESV